MTSYIFVCLLYFTSTHLISAEFHKKSNTVYIYGLPELTRNILEKIKAATGQPIDTNYFIPILASQSKGYEVVEYQPFTKTSKFLKASNKKKLDGGFFQAKKANKGSDHEKDHFYELSESGEDLEDFLKHNYGDHSGKQHKYHEGRFFKTNHLKGHKGTKGAKSKKGRKHGKSYVEKGFRDIYHRDEEKKSDYFWNNRHEEGKWIQYGLRNRKTNKSQDRSHSGKKEKNKSEESTYKKADNKCTKCKNR